MATHCMAPTGHVRLSGLVTAETDKGSRWCGVSTAMMGMRQAPCSASSAASLNHGGSWWRKNRPHNSGQDRRTSRGGLRVAPEDGATCVRDSSSAPVKILDTFAFPEFRLLTIIQDYIGAIITVRARKRLSFISLLIY